MKRQNVKSQVLANHPAARLVKYAMPFDRMGYQIHDGETVMSPDPDYLADTWQGAWNLADRYMTELLRAKVEARCNSPVKA